MKTIFLRTLETTIKKISIIIAVVAGVFVGWLLVETGSYYPGSVYNKALEQLLLFQHLFVFFGLDGVLLICMIAGNTSGLIASETHEGTFKLLAAKPNSRATILLGKILGNIVGLTILMILMLLSYYGTLVVLNSLDGNILKDLIAYLPSYLLYGLLVIVIFSGVSTILSCVCKKKITALLPVLVLMIVAMGFFPIFRLVTALTGASTSKVVTMVDLNYHLALMFKECVSLVGNIKSNQILGYLMNLFSNQSLDADIVRSTNLSGYWMENKSLSAPMVTVVYLAIAIVSYYFSFEIIKKKDI